MIEYYPFRLDRLLLVSEVCEQFSISSEEVFLFWRKRNVTVAGVERTVADAFDNRIG